MAVFRIDKTRDFTVMSNFHLRDKRLSLKSKGLLSQMLSLPEDWDYTLSGLSYINRESKDAIRTAINELEQAGYIERRQTTDEHGRFSVNEYIIHEKPLQEEPLSETPTTETQQRFPSLGNPLLENTTSEITSSENPTQLNIDVQNTEKQITDLSSTDSFILSVPAPKTTLTAMTDGRTERAAARAQIEYERLVNRDNRAQLDELVEIMVEVAMNRGPTIKIGRDAEYPTGYVQDRFRQLTSEHIETVLTGIRENTTRVRNTKAFMLSALFNAVAPPDGHAKLPGR